MTSPSTSTHSAQATTPPPPSTTSSLSAVHATDEQTHHAQRGAAPPPKRDHTRPAPVFFYPEQDTTLFFRSSGAVPRPRPLTGRRWDDVDEVVPHGTSSQTAPRRGCRRRGRRSSNHVPPPGWRPAGRGRTRRRCGRSRSWPAGLSGAAPTAGHATFGSRGGSVKTCKTTCFSASRLHYNESRRSLESTLRGKRARHEPPLWHSAGRRALTPLDVRFAPIARPEALLHFSAPDNDTHLPRGNQ